MYTVEEFDKEKAKLEGEIIAEMDSPRAKVIDSYYKDIYEGHRYGYTNTVILENLKNIVKQDVIDAYKNILDNSKKVLARYQPEYAVRKLERYYEWAIAHNRR